MSIDIIITITLHTVTFSVSNIIFNCSVPSVEYRAVWNSVLVFSSQYSF